MWRLDLERESLSRCRLGCGSAVASCARREGGESSAPWLLAVWESSDSDLAASPTRDSSGPDMAKGLSRGGSGTTGRSNPSILMGVGASGLSGIGDSPDTRSEVSSLVSGDSCLAMGSGDSATVDASPRDSHPTRVDAALLAKTVAHGV